MKLLVTNSALSDQIKEAMKMTRTPDFQICGDYYYDQIDNGILLKKRIEIKSEHMPNELQKYIKTSDSKTIHRAFLRAIIEIFNEKHTGLSKIAQEQNRIMVEYQ